MKTTTQKITRKFHLILDMFFHKKISLSELTKHTNSLIPINKYEQLAREGYFSTLLVVDILQELPYYKTKPKKEQEKHLGTVKKYYEEYKEGIDPRHTNISFKYGYHSPTFNVDVNINPNNS